MKRGWKVQPTQQVWWSGDIFVLMILELWLQLKATLTLQVHIDILDRNLWPFVSFVTPWQWILPLACYSNRYQCHSASSDLYNQYLTKVSSLDLKNSQLCMGCLLHFDSYIQVMANFSDERPKRAWSSGQCMSAEENVKKNFGSPSCDVTAFRSSLAFCQ